MTTTSITVRRAIPADADDVARVHIDGWREGYRGVVDDAILDQLDPDACQRRWRTQLANPRRRTREWVAEVGGVVVAMVEATAVSTDPDASAGVGELMSLYVDAEYRRRGLARLLTDTALADLRAAHCEAVTVWVVDNNERARCFYRSQGWCDDGLARTHNDGIRDVRMRRML